MSMVITFRLYTVGMYCSLIVMDSVGLRKQTARLLSKMSVKLERLFKYFTMFNIKYLNNYLEFLPKIGGYVGNKYRNLMTT